ncbi:TPA: hypothetical protein SMR47_000575 [Pseudomonas putida]|uniref:hypothetical protein n=1 Tax=Pseudomonas sp. NBRC 111142 TaxID=1661057 RepID=UPI0006D3B190|nr:hypothetical protein [Pseudomonas sp. NBRC 111142]HEK1766688.1 hypothetical protein [Pseudomonas putida]
MKPSLTQRLLCLAGLLLLAGCASQSGPAPSQATSLCRQAGICAVSGPETAQLLNNRYRASATRCAIDKPAWQCTGVLLRTRADGATGHFWEHDPAATARGSERLLFLRADLGSDTLPSNHGAIVDDLFSAVSQGKPYEALCSHPLPTADSPARPDHGCAPSTDGPAARADHGSCAALGVNDAQGWLAHFGQQGEQPAAQCAFNADDMAQFRTTLQAHTLLGKPGENAVELLVRNWDAQAPARLAIQALVYDSRSQGGLRAAQQDQRDWFDATGQWLPVLRIDPSQPADQVFGFNLQDQLYIGYQLAQRLNQRFADTAAACRDGSAAFNCNGVLFRTNLATTAFPAWNPSPGSHQNNGVSFSYARADINIRTVAWTRPYAFTFRELAAPMAHRPTLRCAYPYDAGTSGASDPCAHRGECEKLGVDSVAAWMARYSGAPAQGCAFSNTAKQFQLSIEVRNNFPNRSDWNEIMMAAWPDDIPTQIPLESLFYLSGSTGLPQAQFIQHDYFTRTGGFLPLLRLDFTATADPFSYQPAEQLGLGAPATTRSACPSPRPAGVGCHD